jgi:hypothetical protein
LFNAVQPLSATVRYQQIMTSNTQQINNGKWLTVISSVVLLVTFFMPWVNWSGINITGNDLPTGTFFKTAETKFGLPNPFPQLSFSFYAVWLIPALAIAAIVLSFQNKKNWLPAFGAGALSLSVIIVYYLFSGQLTQLGVSNSALSMTKPWLFIHGTAAVILILTSNHNNWFLKTGLILAATVITYFGFGLVAKAGEKKIFDKTFEETASIKADYTLAADSLLKEFITNDTVAKKKYLEKVLVVNGNIGAVEIAADSTSTVKFADSTGSYVIFPLEKNQFDKVKGFKQGDAISLKGVCSGSIFSEILGTTSISFKRVAFNQ